MGASTARTTGAAAAVVPSCRHCGGALTTTMVDLGLSPLCESFVAAADVERGEMFHPLHVRVCDRCLLAQVPVLVGPEEIFSEYAYFSSFSDSWVAHAERYVEQAVERLGLGTDSFVVELASNDGYLLQHVVACGIPCLGVEPAANVAAAARKMGVPTEVAFFGTDTVDGLVGRHRPADLVAANNVFAQVPDVDDFVVAIERLLAPGGVLTVEVPSLERLLDENQFDTIYHEHFWYFSFTSLRGLLAEHGLRVFAVEDLPTHGGSLRLWACRTDDGAHPDEPSVARVASREAAAGLTGTSVYAGFAERVAKVRRDLLRALLDARDAGLSVAAYGAPGKGNTLLNYCGIKPDLIEYTVDRNPYKHGRLLPGSRIPVFPPDRLEETMPDVIVLLPWNLREELAAQLAYTRSWGARLLVPIPSVEVIE